MTAFRIFRRLADLLDVNFSSLADGDAVVYDQTSGKFVNEPVTGGGGSSTLAGLSDVTGVAGTGKAPVSDGAGAFPLTDIATQTELAAEATARSNGDAASVATAEAYTDTAVANLISSAPGALDTLDELAAALGDDANFATTVTTALAGKQPLDSDLTAIAALSTTSFGRGLLALADAAALRSAAALGTAATASTGDFDASGAAAAAQAASQPLDSDLTAIAALSTTSFGRGLLALADAAALRTAASLVVGTDVEAHDSDLTTIAGLTPTNDDVLQRKAGAWTNRTMAQLIADLAALGTTFQPLDSELTALAGLTSAADKLPYFTGSGSAAVTSLSSFIRTLLDDADAATARATLGISGGAKLFDSTLGADTATIDTGAGGIAGGYDVAEVWIIARTDEAATRSTLKITVNNDTSAIYDFIWNRARSTGITEVDVEANTEWQAGIHGASGSSGYATVIRLTIPGYAQTNFWKVAEMTMANADATAANMDVLVATCGYRATTAVSRMAITLSGGPKLKTGSRLLVYGR